MTAIAQPADNPNTTIEVLASVNTVIAKSARQQTVQKIPDYILCNCYAYVKNKFANLPSTYEILNSLTFNTGEVAVFYYRDSGLYHYALVKEIGEDYIKIEETNYKRCRFSERIIPRNNPDLLGYFSI